jgi:ribose transport system ATP-binding protein
VVRLFDLVRELKRSGVGIVYVSHRLDEVLEIADRVSVLRDGREAGTVDRSGTDERQLVTMMIGHELPESAEPSRARAGGGELVLRAGGLGRPPRLRGIDLELRKGEIVGVFGLVGAGRTRLARALFGLEPASEGTLELFGERVTVRSSRDAIAAGIGYVGEDRSAGLVPKLSVAANMTLASLGSVSRGPLLDRAAEQRIARRYLEELGVRAGSPDQRAGSLSGGNQQKVLLARWYCSGARILLLDDPTRGIDVGAKEEVFRLLRRLRDEGVATLYLTSEIKEARMVADRLLVMAKGRIVKSTSPGAPDAEIMAAAGGIVT